MWTKIWCFPTQMPSNNQLCKSWASGQPTDHAEGCQIGYQINEFKFINKT